jgi:GR25 family glycosyltransferase involved in LPS biosynthesis
MMCVYNMDIIKQSWVINLDRRPDRSQEFVERMNESTIVFPNLKKFHAIDGQELFARFPKRLNDDVLQYLKILLTEQLWTDEWMITEGEEGRWRQGEIGCLLTHYSLFLDIIKNEQLEESDISLIMEDDLFVNDDVVSEMQKICKMLEGRPDIRSEIDVLWIAGRNRTHFIPSDLQNISVYEKIDDTDGLFHRKQMDSTKKEDWYRQTTAYMITKRGAKKVIDQMKSRHFVKPIDHCMMEANIKQYDWFPHVGYSPMDYKSDVQGGTVITPYHVLRIVLYNQYSNLLDVYRSDNRLN